MVIHRGALGRSQENVQDVHEGRVSEERPAQYNGAAGASERPLVSRRTDRRTHRAC